MSAESILPVGAIRLFDRDTNDDDRNSACWAKSVEITDYIIVNGSNTNIGAFVVWNVRVETLTVSKYSVSLHERPGANTLRLRLRWLLSCG